MLHPGDQEETIEIIELDSFRLERALDVIVEILAGAHRDRSIRQTVIMKKFSASGFERREIVIVGSRITWVESFSTLDSGVIEILPRPCGIVVQEVPRVVDSRWGVFRGGDDGLLESDFGDEGEAWEDECLVYVYPVVVELVEGVDLRSG
jgi:hypothetical protein